MEDPQTTKRGAMQRAWCPAMMEGGAVVRELQFATSRQ